MMRSDIDGIAENIKRRNNVSVYLIVPEDCVIIIVDSIDIVVDEGDGEVLWWLESSC
jgi:hypothetical protein